MTCILLASIDNLFVQESWFEIKEDGLVGLGESDVYESFATSETELFEAFAKENDFVGDIHVDLNGESVQVGWIFQSEDKYEDCDETYQKETWVTVHDGLPKKVVEYNYHRVGRREREG